MKCLELTINIDLLSCAFMYNKIMRVICGTASVNILVIGSQIKVMNKKQGILIGIALMLLFPGIALATSTTLSAPSNIIIHAFDQNPAGSDKGNEWVALYNPSNESVDMDNWILENADGEREIILEGTSATLYPFAYYVLNSVYLPQHHDYWQE